MTHLIGGVDAGLHTGELKFADKLTEADAMKVEFLNFNRSLSAAGRATYQARSGQHDDLVLSVAIAVWAATREFGPPRPWFGVYGSDGIRVTSGGDDDDY